MPKITGQRGVVDREQSHIHQPAFAGFRVSGATA